MTDRPRSPIEERLRAALAHRADHIEPSPDGLDRIEEKLMSSRLSTNQRWILGTVSAAAVVLLVVLGAIVLGEDDGDSDVAADSTSTTVQDTSTTSSSTTETTTTTTPFPADVDPYGVAYPSPTTSQRFDSPQAVAQAFASEVLGFTELEVGEYREGDSRSGEVPITDRPGNTETIVLVRQMEDDHWYALASVTEDITVDTPAAGDEVSSPFDTTGSVLAFEGTVNVIVRAQDDPEILGEGHVTGSGTPPAGPFEGSIEFTPPAQDTPGIVVYRELSAEDGHVTRATSFPVHLLPG